MINLAKRDVVRQQGAWKERFQTAKCFQPLQVCLWIFVRLPIVSVSYQPPAQLFTHSTCPKMCTSLAIRIPISQINKILQPSCLHWGNVGMEFGLPIRPEMLHISLYYYVIAPWKPNIFRVGLLRFMISNQMLVCVGLVWLLFLWNGYVCMLHFVLWPMLLTLSPIKIPFLVLCACFIISLWHENMRWNIPTVVYHQCVNIYTHLWIYVVICQVYIVVYKV